MKFVHASLLLILGILVACCTYKSTAVTPAQNANATFIAPQTETKSVSPQEKPICTLTIEQAPEINGLRLGMTADQVLALFPGSNEDNELRTAIAAVSPYGVSGFVIRPEKYQTKDTFAGIAQITFSLLDGKASSITVNYSGLEFKHVDEFVARFSQGRSLPPADAWEAYVGMDTQMKTLNCHGFEVRVFAGSKGVNLSYVLMRDLGAEKELKARRDKARKAREAASPTTPPS